MNSYFEQAREIAMREMRNNPTIERAFWRIPADGISREQLIIVGWDSDKWAAYTYAHYTPCGLLPAWDCERHY